MNLYETAVEKSRQRMVDVAVKHGYTAEETVRASQHLDKLLNLGAKPIDHRTFTAYKTFPNYKKADSESF